MSRIEKRCLLGSVSMHVFLLLVLLVGPAFFAPQTKQITRTPPLTVVPSKLVDDALSGGGGNPNVKPSNEKQKGSPDAALIQIPIRPEPIPAKPEPPKPEPAPPKPPKPEPAPAKETKATPPKTQEKSKPAETAKPLLQKITSKELEQLQKDQKSSSKSAAEKEAQIKADARAREQARSLASAIQGLRRGWESGTAVEVHGTGGEAYANYAQTVFQIYDDAWTLTKDVGDNDDATKVRVVVERSGRIIEAKIIRPSGNGALDKTVQRALNHVQRLPAFPTSSTDAQRTFLINFTVAGKLNSG